jgi:hypothetical protein
MVICYTAHVCLFLSRVAAPGEPNLPANAAAAVAANNGTGARPAVGATPVPTANAVPASATTGPRPPSQPPKPAGKGPGHNLKTWGFADVKDGDTWRIAEVIETKEDNLQFRFLVSLQLPSSTMALL